MYLQAKIEELLDEESNKGTLNINLAPLIVNLVIKHLVDGNTLENRTKMNTNNLIDSFSNNNIEDFKKFEQERVSEKLVRSERLMPVLMFDSDKDIEYGDYSFQIENFSFQYGTIVKIRINPSSPIFGYRCENYGYIMDNLHE